MKLFTHMKRLLFLILALVTLTGGIKAENYFQDGAQWFETMTYIIGNANGITDHTSQLLYTLKGHKEMYGHDCLCLYRQEMTENDADYGEPSLVNYLRVEDDKVYFLPNTVSEEWVLLYDFTLKEGEGCTVGIMPYPWNENSRAITTYVKCVGYGQSEVYGGWPVMYLDEYDTADASLCYGRGEWLTGVGSPDGVENNNYFHADSDSGCTLDKLILNGEIICSGPSGIETIDVAASQITVNGNVISSANEHVTLYGVDGRQIGSGRQVPAPTPGLYIVTDGLSTLKIRVK